jgi:hypothetical protein
MRESRVIESVSVEFEVRAVAASPFRPDADRVEPVFDSGIGCVKIRQPREQRASVAKRLTIQVQLERRLRKQAGQGLRFDAWILEHRKPIVNQYFDALFDNFRRCLERRWARIRARSHLAADSRAQSDECC